LCSIVLKAGRPQKGTKIFARQKRHLNDAARHHEKWRAIGVSSIVSFLVLLPEMTDSPASNQGAALAGKSAQKGSKWRNGLTSFGAFAR
jgi:hypothetical protein